MKHDPKPPQGTITISGPVLEVFRRAAEKDKMDVVDFISQQLALCAGMLAESGWVDFPGEKEKEPPCSVAEVWANENRKEGVGEPGVTNG